MEILKYIVEDSTIAELLGVQNFTTDEAAILELIKNSYDANALEVTLKFNKNHLEIIDDGIGMSVDNIKYNWMHIGKSSKGYEVVDKKKKKRIQAGSKGIGRFALARLGRNISLYTKTETSSGLVWETDWNKSVIDEDIENITNGTRICINNLREKWGRKRIEKLANYLSKTYNDKLMKIKVVSDDFSKVISKYFPAPKPGINCRSNIVLKYNNGSLKVSVKSDEFEEKAKRYCPNIDFNNYEISTLLLPELKGLEEIEGFGLEEDKIENKLKELGEFSANLFFNITASNNDKDKFLYKYLNTTQSIPKGIILYRNAFGISSYEGEKDWLGLGKRSRKSPAAASHPTGAWRVRENQISGFVQIDKKENNVLQDLSNRQGLDENIYYILFIQIILIGIKEFERYRQNIIRKINVKNIEVEKPTPISDQVINNPDFVAKLNNEQRQQLIEEIETIRKEGKQYKGEKENTEKRYKYDVRILNVLATIGLKASSVAHELKNDKNIIYDNYNYIVDALKGYDIWDILNSEENTKKAYKNVPYLLEQNEKISKKIFIFISTMLSEIEKKQFKSKHQSLSDIIVVIKNKWEYDYSWVKIGLEVNNSLLYKISEDVIQVILDNLILNSIQQNDIKKHLNINIKVEEFDELIKFKYSDNGNGLNEKYLSNPNKILEVHETTRENGHGLGMWIVNNTVTISGGEIQNIDGKNKFYIEFTIGDKS